jgi:hypothetical protein
MSDFSGGEEAVGWSRTVRSELMMRREVMLDRWRAGAGAGAERFGDVWERDGRPDQGQGD